MKPILKAFIISSSSSTSKIAVFEPQPSLEDPARIVYYVRPSGFHFFGFRKSIFLRGQGCQPCAQPPPPPGGPGPCSYVPQ
jgi:hypothetical protein